MEARKCHEH